MRKELLRAGIGVGIFLLLLVGVVVFAPQAKKNQASGNVSADAAPVEQSGFGESGPFMGEQIIPPRLAADFDLINRTGEHVRMKDFQGKLVLLSFAYTSCPDVCPILFSGFLGVQEELANHIGRDLELAFISVDPEVDTPERMNGRTEELGGRWYFLTGPLPDMKEVWKDYRVYVEKKGMLVSHTTITYLIDRNGLIRIRYLGLPPAKVFITDIQEMLEQ